MKLGQKVFIASLFLFICLALFAQSTSPSALPRELLRPQYGEDPKFPKDYVIGELGRGGATEQSYQMARRLVASLAAGNGNLDEIDFPERKRLTAVSQINALGTRSWRIGGGRAEGGGAFSFLVRFLGRERSITGELYLQWEEPKPIVIEESAEPAAEPTVTETETSLESENKENGNGVANGNGTANGNGNGVAASNGNGNGAANDNGDTAVAESETEAEAEEPEVDMAALEEVTSIASVDPSGTVETSAPVQLEQPRWRVDDLLLEPPRRLSDGKYGPGNVDMTPYERFF